jgi:hypothetical protein
MKTIEQVKPKRVKTGGKTKQGINPVTAMVKVPATDKGSIARFRDYLNNPIARDYALDMLVWLDKIVLDNKEPINFWAESNKD